MFSKTSALTGLIAAIGLLCFSITPSSAKDQAKKDDCGPGEVLVADGVGGGVCNPLAAVLSTPIEPAVSACPCAFLASLSSPFRGSETTSYSCTAQDTLQPIDDGQFDFVGGLGTSPQSLVVGQDTFGLDMFCFRTAGPDRPSNVIEAKYIASVIELGDCIEDFQTVANALGVSCPEPPVFILP